MARVLLVEDNEFVRDILRSEMEDSGHRVDCVGRRTEAELALGQVAYDLLVCDMHLPDGSGDDLIARAGKCGIRALIISGALDAMAERLAAVGATSLQKPFRLADLRKAIALSLSAERPANPSMALTP